MFSSNTTQVSGGYEIQRSLRFNSADSAYLNRTPASAGNRRTFTVSLWVKKAALGTRQYLWEGGSPDSITTRLFLRFNTDDTLRLATSGTVIFNTTQVFRDPSAWYHIVVAVDTPNATQANRTRLYVNGTEVTTFSSSSPFSQNDDTGWNMAQAHSIGRSHIDGADYLSAYLTEMYNIDGQALTPSSFGEINADTGVWQPKRYAGSYGTNGFYLNFSDNSNTTAATLGADYSGNGNNWTPNNFSVSAGAGNDSLVDVPTNWGVDTGVGGSVRGNYCTLNPLDNGGLTLSNGNLQFNRVGGWLATKATFGMSSGKWYWEIPILAIGASGFAILGIGLAAAPNSSYVGSDSLSWGYVGGSKYTGGSAVSYGTAFGVNDVVGVAFDADAGSITFYNNGVSQGVAFSGLAAGTYFPMVSLLNDYTAAINFGQRPFAYTAPSGFKALNTQNLPTPTIGATPATQAGKFFNPVLYTGNGTTNNISGVGFETDFVWMKNRTTARNHYLMDRVRGITNKVLESNTTTAEQTGTIINSTNSDGYQLSSGDGGSNTNGDSYVSWNWKANGAGVTNTAGTITSTVSANTTSGFSVVTYAGNSTLGATIGHGLGKAPSMVIVKSRSGTTNWVVYHAAVGNTKALFLNTTSATDTDNFWNNTSPTSTVFSVNASTGLNSSGSNYVAYCFAEVPGYSKFGSYTGNGSADGPFLYLGFTPKYILIKQSSSAGTNWRIITINTSYLSANTADAQYDNPPGPIRGMSNGVKIVGTGGDINGNGSTFIYAAFAAFPFKYALAQSA